MKIYILPVSDYLQPETQGFIWPPGCDDYGVEQDFLLWLQKQTYLLTDNPKTADWHYLPVFWNRWYLTTDEPRKTSPTFQVELDRALVEPRKTFTICEYDPYGLQPGTDLHHVTVFSANRVTGAVSDIPLLLHPHQIGSRAIARLAVFRGHLGTHPIRRKMQTALAGCRDCLVTDQPKGIGDFVRDLRSSYLALAPRGDGAQSYRFYEAMQAGVAPLYLSDVDARPFKEHVDWDAVSLYRDNTEGLCDYIRGLDTSDLVQMGERAAVVYREQLQYGKWCRYVIDGLG